MGLRSASSAVILVDQYCVRKIALVAVQGNNGENGTTGMWSGIWDSAIPMIFPNSSEKEWKSERGFLVCLTVQNQSLWIKQKVRV